MKLVITNFIVVTTTEKSGIRMSADERRAAILAAAIPAFADGGYAGTSTEEIARAAGISQPYLFRLFGTKKGLFIAVLEHCWDRVTHIFDRAADGLEGEAVLAAMGDAYLEELKDADLLLVQFHGYAASSDEEIRDHVARRFSELTELVRSRSGVDQEHVQQFFATGMLLNVIAALRLTSFGDLCAIRDTVRK